MTNGSILVPCWMVGQEFGCCYVDLFSSDNFLAIVKAEANGHEDLATICEAVCQNMVDDTEFIKATLLPPKSASPLLVDVWMAAERVFKICRCFGHLLALKLPGEETTFKDVQHISKYAGKSLCERVLRDVIVKANSSWSNLVEDVIKTAGKAALLSGERQEMEKFLGLEIPLQAMDLEIGINLYKKILGSMRKVELQKCSEELKDKLQKQAQHILAQGPTGINSMDVDQLLIGLNLFSAEPGVLSLVQEVQEYMTKHRSALALSDLQAVIEAGGEQLEASQFGNIKLLVSKCAPNAPLPEELTDKVDEFLRNMLLKALDEASCYIVLSLDSIVVRAKHSRYMYIHFYVFGYLSDSNFNITYLICILCLKSHLVG